MGQSTTECAAALCDVLKAGVAAMGAPLPVLEDSNVETGENPPVGGYVQVKPLRVIGERQHTRSNTFATYLGTFSWALEIFTPRNTGEGAGSDLAAAIAGMFRGKVIGDLTVTSIDIEPLERQAEDPYFETDVLIFGEKLSDYDAT
jgi:hypothetical protein